jgi:copper chaperone
MYPNITPLMFLPLLKYKSMTTTYFSNINCAACVAKVTPALNELVGADKWQVDTSARNKVLSLVAEEPVSLDLLNEKLASLGYKVRPASE